MFQWFKYLDSKIKYNSTSGHTKQKFGVNREPSPVTFMKEWVDFISCNGEDEFKK